MKSKSLAVLVLLAPLCCLGQTYTFSTLVNFPATTAHSAVNPFALTLDSAGNLYGVSYYGGANGVGSLFKVTPKGAVSIIYSFSGLNGDGELPFGSVIRDTQGNLYGQTFLGGTNGFGTIFKITPNGHETILYNVPTELDGTGQSMTRDTAGNLYGYTGHNGYGSVFELTAGGTFITLYTFCSLTNCADGLLPSGGPILRNGKLYGVTSQGGANNCGAFNCGTAFEVDTSGNETVLYNFTGGNDGKNPENKLAQDTAGNLYGVTETGGAHDWGTLFKITPSGKESTVYAFCAQSQCTDGASPNGPVVLDAAGNIYGISQGTGVGPNLAGLVYKITPGGVETTLHDATGPAGVGYALAIDKAGNLYGNTWAGGPSHNGNVFKLTKK